MSRQRGGTGVLWASFLVAFALALWPLPEYLAAFRPNWLALVLCYWVLEAPQRVGLGTAFVLGLAADLMFGSLIGEQALRLCVIAFILLRFRAQLRYFTLLQQAAAVLALLLNDRVVVLMIRALAGEGWPPASFWIAPAVGAVLWPWIFLLLDDVRLRLRAREGS
ncbi:MAG TPA: rod shape-determining protein MreD [Chiayiivirga sp.]|uniref:Rod shape-determining protein MreD n=1 Tax=Denitratimonas tolerans TaxID=1338420 RepID=A0AAW9R365_9GAMM|nr:rod shape-determining protein MreD [Chiayiivirga sp.]MEB2315500.1 rod shape-determining protein MreD [Xanthomonadaceae bacterium]HMN35365.1 rod shape-determining protein MreD [Chiayiivirga sp.]HRN59044.1 rod shape-determining protein MreD [Chiayiivirga sp.]HRO86863.1 rod shape-determining protein MreD [Chiayiivirga sp.]